MGGPLFTLSDWTWPCSAPPEQGNVADGDLPFEAQPTGKIVEVQLPPRWPCQRKGVQATNREQAQQTTEREAANGATAHEGGYHPPS